MKNKIKNISVEMKSSFVYTIAVLFSRGLAIITVPIFSRLMPTEQMGVVTLYNSWYTMILSVTSLSLTSGGYMVALKEFSGSRDRYVSSVLSLTSITSVMLLISYFISPSFWCNITGLSSDLFIMLIMGTFFLPATDFWLARQRYEYKYKLAAIVIFLSALVSSAFAVVTIVIANNNGVTQLGSIRLYTNNIVMFGTAIVIWISIMVKGKTFFDRNFWIFSLKLSIPLIGNSIASQILSVSDRVMIGKIVGDREVGIYGVLYTVSSLSLIVWGAINSSFVPYLFSHFDDENKESIKSNSFTIMLGYGGVAILATLLAPEIVRIIATEEYYEAICIMPPIAAGVFLTSISNMYSNVLIYLKKTQYIMISSIIAAGLNVILNYFSIKRFGYMAAAYTTLISYIVLALIQAFIAIKFSKCEVYDNKRLLLLSVGIIILCMLSELVYDTVFVRYGILLVVLLVLYLQIKKNMKKTGGIKNERN